MSNIDLYLKLLPLALIFHLIPIVLFFHRNKTKEFIDLKVFYLCSLGIGLGNWAELKSLNARLSLFFSNMTYLFISLLAVSWFLFSRRDQRSAIPRKMQMRTLSFFSLVTTVLKFTDAYHHWIWKEWHSIFCENYRVNIVDQYGFWFWIHVVCCYGLFIWGALSLLTENIKNWRLYRFRASMFILGTLVPVITNSFYLLRSITGLNIDISSITLPLSGICFTLGITKGKLFQLSTSKQSIIYEFEKEGIVMINSHCLISNINPTALKHYNLSRAPIRRRFTDIRCIQGQGITLKMLLSDRPIERAFLVDNQLLKISSEQSHSESFKGYVIRSTLLEEKTWNLSEREKEVYNLLISNQLIKRFPDSLGISLNTVNTHIRNIYKKTGCHSRKELQEFESERSLQKSATSLE